MGRRNRTRGSRVHCSVRLQPTGHELAGEFKQRHHLPPELVLPHHRNAGPCGLRMTCSGRAEEVEARGSSLHLALRARTRLPRTQLPPKQVAPDRRHAQQFRQWILRGLGLHGRVREEGEQAGGADTPEEKMPCSRSLVDWLLGGSWEVPWLISNCQHVKISSIATSSTPASRQRKNPRGSLLQPPTDSRWIRQRSSAPRTARWERRVA